MGVGDPIDENKEDVEVRDLSRTLETPSRTLGNHCMGVGDPLDEDKEDMEVRDLSKTLGAPSGTPPDAGDPLDRGQRTPLRPYGPFYGSWGPLR